jgi:ElaB/YqjD/DUF883 family membrane-anchored ribosome-binding protein
MKGKIITGKEINNITKECPPREKAFFTIMRQSGLPPHTIKQVKVRDVEKILEPNTPRPCRINVPHEKRPTYIGEEAVKYTKRYLKTRKDLTTESPLFTIRNDPDKEINIKSESRTFTTIARRIDRSTKLTLYSLIDFYRVNAKEYLTELKRYDTPEDDELYRQLYEEKAMPYLEIEELTPIEIHKLKDRLRKIENLLPKEQEIELPPEFWEQMERETEEAERYEKWLREHPEEQQKIREENQKLLEDYPEAEQIVEQIDAEAEWADKIYRERLEERVKELENRLKEIEDAIKKPKEKTKRHS